MPKWGCWVVDSWGQPPNFPKPEGAARDLRWAPPLSHNRYPHFNNPPSLSPLQQEHPSLTPALHNFASESYQPASFIRHEIASSCLDLPSPVYSFSLSHATAFLLLVGPWSLQHTNDSSSLEQCDEGRPECRNCMKSKRVCQGYDPVFQSQAPHSIHPAPSSTTLNSSHNNSTPSSSSINNHSRAYHTDPASPPVGQQNNSILPSSTRNHIDYPYPRPPEQVLPHLNQPYHMDGTSQGGLSQYSPPRHRELRLCVTQPPLIRLLV
jgi:hypothetical protein